MPTRRAKDLWQHLVDELGEEEIERAASVSVEQAEAELAAAGFDVAAERAKANAFLDALGKGDVEWGAYVEKLETGRARDPRGTREKP